MDLENMKKDWEQVRMHEPKHANIMELIRDKHSGPVSGLKKAIKKQIRLMIIVPLMLFMLNIDETGRLYNSIIFWSYIAFCVGLIIFWMYNYRLVKRMEIMDTNVKENLEHQVTLLERSLRLKQTGVRIALLFFILLAEIAPYVQHYRMLDKWHALSPWIRFGAYGVLLILQYFANHRLTQKRFGGHLTYLKALASQLERND